MYWINKVCGVFFQNWKPSENRKFIYSGSLKKQEYLFCYFLTFFGIDVFMLRTENDTEPGKALENLSIDIRLGEFGKCDIPQYLSEGAENKNIVVNTRRADRDERTRQMQNRQKVFRDSQTQRNSGAILTPEHIIPKQELAFEELALLASSIVIITIILSYFTLIFGELVPKRIAMENAEKFSKFSISIITALAKIMSPFVKFLTWSTDCVSKIFGVSKENEETVTEEEIRMMVDVGEEKGTIKNEEKEMINNVFELNDTEVSEIMVHRTEMFALDKELTVSDVSKKLVEGEYRYSRIPVYDEDIDSIVGILYIKELLRANSNTKIKKIMKDALFVPESKRIDELFKEMQKNKVQIAIVADEYGGTAGMVTMEDVLEEIVGDIFSKNNKSILLHFNCSILVMPKLKCKILVILK